MPLIVIIATIVVLGILWGVIIDRRKQTIYTFNVIVTELSLYNDMLTVTFTQQPDTTWRVHATLSGQYTFKLVHDDVNIKYLWKSQDDIATTDTIVVADSTEQMMSILHEHNLLDQHFWIYLLAKNERMDQMSNTFPSAPPPKQQ